MADPTLATMRRSTSGMLRGRVDGVSEQDPEQVASRGQASRVLGEEDVLGMPHVLDEAVDPLLHVRRRVEKKTCHSINPEPPKQ